MIYPAISDLMEKTDSRYSLVVATAKRARELVDGAQPLVKFETGKQVTIAINEICQGKIKLKYPPAKKQAQGEETKDVQQ